MTAHDTNSEHTVPTLLEWMILIFAVFYIAGPYALDAITHERSIQKVQEMKQIEAQILATPNALSYGDPVFINAKTDHYFAAGFSKDYRGNLHALACESMSAKARKYRETDDYTLTYDYDNKEWIEQDNAQQDCAAVASGFIH
ncbi:hypothetical protein [Paraburkholderia aromaticivorans]|uniref:hypothetical protein n=1 Tax=Paraburkholderia aromaticivorans TaxID=2026199 RepID=UPI0038BCE3A2